MKRTQKLEKLHKSVNFERLKYYFQGSTKDINLNDFINAETIFDDIKFKRIRFDDAEKNKWNLNRN